MHGRNEQWRQAILNGLPRNRWGTAARLFTARMQRKPLSIYRRLKTTSGTKPSQCRCRASSILNNCVKGSKSSVHADAIKVSRRAGGGDVRLDGQLPGTLCSGLAGSQQRVDPSRIREEGARGSAAARRIRTTGGEDYSIAPVSARVGSHCSAVACCFIRSGKSSRVCPS